MQIDMIALNKLVPSAVNTRKTGRDTGIDELASSIAAHGLLQNLHVRPAANGKYEVIAGGRRLAALRQLAKTKRIAKDLAIPCHIVSDGDAVEISLAENVMRVSMHPADQYEAFKALADQGSGPEEIAARFGCSPVLIQQRLKLASVSPVLLAAYRAGEMELDQLMAFTVSNDHAAQEKVWDALPSWNCHPSTIRRVLTQTHVEASDRRARFVGMDAYVAAGGNVLRDLFDSEHEGYLTDPGLLDRLVAEKLEREAEMLRTEGWKWVEIEPEFDYQHLREFARVYPERREPDDAQQAEIDRLTTEYEDLVAEYGEDPPENLAAQLEDLSNAIDDLTAGVVMWSAEDIARAGAIIGIGHAGRILIERGLLRDEDAQEGDRGVDAKDLEPRGRSKQRRQDGLPQLPASLIEDLTAHRTAALRTVLAGDPEIALVAVVHALALFVFYHHGAESCLTIRVEQADLRVSADGIDASPAAAALAERYEAWLRRLPSDSAALWSWLTGQQASTRMDLLAHCAGSLVDAVCRRHDPGADRLLHADELAQALKLDMAQWWQPTTQSYLGRVSKALILEAVAEGVSPEAAENLAKLKKDALAALAEERLAGIGWLPAVLRPPIKPASQLP